MGSIEYENVLNPEQYKAVVHGAGPQLVLAGAGSGKTRVITHRIAWLIGEQEVDPSRIVAVTFTNKAASEMRERVEKLVDRYPLETFLGTFHRLALRLLRRYGPRVGLPREFVIFDADDQIALVKEALKIEQISEQSFAPRAVRSVISSAKNQLIYPKRYSEEAKTFYERQVAKLYDRYQKLLAKAGGVDFDDMLALAVRVLSEPELQSRIQGRVDHLLVDEFQDTNHAQMQMVLALIGKGGNLTAVGDEDQGIYRWRGADLDNVLEFDDHFPGASVRMLERNYRSTQNILTASGKLVAHNRNRRDKQLWTDAGDGAAVELYKARDEQDEARWTVSTLSGLQPDTPLNEMGILVRTNAQTRALEEELLRRQIPYVLVGGVRFYQRAEIKDLVAYLRVLKNPRDDFALRRILNQPPRGIGKTSRQLLENAAASQGETLWDVLLHDHMDGIPDRAKRALFTFRDLILDLQEQLETQALSELMEDLLDATQYTSLYKKGDPEGETKLENIREFLSAAQEFDEEQEDPAGDLTAFLDHVALVADIDSWQAGGGVSVMTLHSAKGLEFDAVVVTGLEEGVLPHFNAMSTPDEIEEERRLLYVGMTRAKKRLHLTTCRRRRIAGRYQDQLESPFLLELPEEQMVVHQSPELFEEKRLRGVYSFFDSPAPAKIAPKMAGELTVEPTDQNARKGRRVRHPKLGDGVILDLEGSGDQLKITVFFDRAGKRKLVAKFAGLDLL